MANGGFKKMIEGIIQTPLKQFPDDRGKVMHMLRSTDSYFQKFGEVYFSWIYPDVIKGWYKHLEMTQNYVVPIGCVKVVLYDDRPHSSTYKKFDEYLMNSGNYFLLTTPPGIWYGLQTIGNEPAMIVNCTTLPHDPEEKVRLDLAAPLIPYFWH